MKIKGISPIEQHVEKLVLVVFALFAMAMFVLQFNIFGDPNAVQIDQNRKVAPAKAVEAISDLARRKEGEIDAAISDDIPDPPGPLDRFNEASQTPAVPRQWASVALYPGAGVTATPIDPTDNGNVPAAADRVVQIEAPTPTQPFARAFGSTVDPLAPVQVPGLAALLPEGQPYDIRAVTVQATFPASELRAALADVPANDTVRALPRSWWVDQVEILDVEVSRDELALDGSVVATTTLPPLPGVASLRERISAADVAPRDLPQILSDERSNREAIRRSPFPPTISGPPWIWPALAAERDATDPNRVAVQRLVDERRRVMAEIERLKNPRPVREREEERRSDPPPGPSPSGGPRPPGGGRDSGASSAANIAKRIEDLTKRAADIETRLRDEFERTVDGEPLKKLDDAVFVESVTSITAADATETVTVWTHDMHPEPGKRYQYRVRVWITNPLFGHGDQVGPDQRSAAASLAIATPWSAPTDVISVHPSPAAFVASASTGEGLGGIELRRPATASLDVFAFHYGYWRGTDITLSPGDQLRAEIPIPSLPSYEIKVVEGSQPEVGEITSGPELLPISRDVFLVGVVPPASGSGDLVFLSRPDGTVEVRRAGADAESDAAARLRDSDARSRKAKVGDPGSNRPVQ